MVQMDRRESAMNAIKLLSQVELMGRQLQIRWVYLLESGVLLSDLFLGVSRDSMLGQTMVWYIPGNREN